MIGKEEAPLSRHLNVLDVCDSVGGSPLDSVAAGDPAARAGWIVLVVTPLLLPYAMRLLMQFF